MIKQLVFILWVNLLAGLSFAQQNHLFTSLEEALVVHPDSVYRLDLSRNQLKAVPVEIMQFKNLREIDLSKNKLTDLPENFVFKNLAVVNLTKNKFEVFPTALCKNTGLTQLLMGKNKISELPECIGNLSELVILDVWFNTVSVIPASIVNLKKLRSFDLRGMNYSDEFQQEWREKLPWVKLEFDVGCDCGY